MKNLKALLLFWIINVVGFYTLPFAIRNTGGAILVMLMAIPLICFVCALIYGLKNGFNFIYSLVVAVLFIPSLFIFYNETAWGYTIAYLIIAIVGNLLGMVFCKREKQK